MELLAKRIDLLQNQPYLCFLPTDRRAVSFKKVLIALSLYSSVSPSLIIDAYVQALLFALWLSPSLLSLSL